MEVVGFVGDDGWPSCIDWPELSVPVVSIRVIADSAGSDDSAIAPSTVCRKLDSLLSSSILFFGRLL